MPTVGLAQPREFASPQTAQNTIIDLASRETQIIQEDSEAPSRVYITRTAPLRYQTFMTRNGPIQVPSIDKGKFWCLPEVEFKAAAFSVAVRCKEYVDGGRLMERSGRVIVVDVTGKMVARFNNVPQALEIFAKFNFDPKKLHGSAKLFLPAVRPAAPRVKKGQLSVDQIAAAAVAAVMAANRGTAPAPQVIETAGEQPQPIQPKRQRKQPKQAEETA